MSQGPPSTGDEAARARRLAADILRQVADQLTEIDHDTGEVVVRVQLDGTEGASPEAETHVTGEPADPAPHAAPPYFADLVQCAERCPLVQNCNRTPSLPRRYLPRGTTSRARPGEVRLMVVMANPGQPLPSEDDDYRVRPDPRDVADAAWQLTARILEGKAHFSSTLDRVLEEAAFLLDCAPDEVLDQCVMTNHVRCSTPRPFSSYQSGAEREQRRETSQRCIERHLRDEIAYWRPHRIAVFSSTAREALDRAGIEYDGEISHPTAMGANLNRDVRRAKLTELKRRLGF